MKKNSLILVLFCILFSMLPSITYPFSRDVLTVLGISSGEEIAYSPNGRILAMVRNDIIFLLEAQTYTQVGVLMEEADRPRNNILSIAFSPDGSVLASGHNNGVITIWDMRRMEKKISFQAHEGIYTTDEVIEGSETVTDLAFHPGGEVLASAGDDRTIKLWHVRTWKELEIIRGHTDGVSAIAFHPLGKFMASGGWDGTVRIWDIRADLSITDGPVLHDQGHIRSLAVNVTDEMVIAFCSVDDTSERGVVKLWKGLTGFEPVELQADGSSLHPVFEPDGGTLITAGDRVRFWSVEGGKIVQSLSRHSESHVIALHPDGRTLASVKQSAPLRIWDVVAEQLKAELPENGFFGFDFRFSDDGKYVISAAGASAPQNGIEVQRWDIESGRLVSTSILSGAPPDYPRDYTTGAGLLSPDGGQFAVKSDKRIYRWRLPEGEFLPLFEVSGVLMAYSVHGTMAVADPEGVIYLLDSDTGAEKGVLDGRNRMIQSMVFSSNGRFLASGDSDGFITLWNVAEFEQLNMWHAHEKWFTNPRNSGVLSLSFSPDGQLLASGGGVWDHTVKLWDVENGAELLKTLAGHETAVKYLGFSPNGRLLISAGESVDWSDAVILWDVEKAESLWTFGYGSHKLRFDPTGSRIAMEIGRYIFVWNVDRLIKEDFVTAVSDGAFSVRWSELRCDAVAPGCTLLPNYPNPFNAETWIPFKLSKGSEVAIEIRDATGYLVRKLSLGYKPVNSYIAKGKAAYWDGKNESGERVSSGIYFCTIKADDFKAVRKMVLAE